MTLQMRSKTRPSGRRAVTARPPCGDWGSRQPEDALTATRCTAQIGCRASLAGFGINFFQQYPAWLACACVLAGVQAAQISLRSSQDQAQRCPGLRCPWPARRPSHQCAPQRFRCFASAAVHFDAVHVWREVIRIGQPDPASRFRDRRDSLAGILSVRQVVACFGSGLRRRGQT